MQRKQKAFTLVELLVVIAIIALMMSIMLPALHKVKEQAKRVSCASNLRQIGFALAVYAENYNGFLPPPYKPGARAPYESYLAYAYDPDTPYQLAKLYDTHLCENPEVFYCPSQPGRSAYTAGCFSYSYYNQGRGWHIIPSGDWCVRTSYNYWIYGKEKIEQLKSKVIVVDCIQHWDYVPHRKSNDDPLGLNALFNDGHVNFSSGNDLFDEDLWGLVNGVSNPSVGPGNNLDWFVEILSRMKP